MPFLLLLILAVDAPWTLRRVETQLPLDPSTGTTVRIENPHGTVRTRPGNPGGIVLLANVQEHQGGPNARVHHERTEEGLRLWVELDEAGEPHPQVDLGLRIPTDVEIEIETTDGLIEIKDHAASVRARSTSGAIRVAGSGPLRARSESGRVAVVFRDAPSARTSEVQTTSGEIVTWLPDSPDLLLQAATRGEITTDFSIDIDREPETQWKSARARIGIGDAELVLSSEAAPIRILRATP